MGIRRRFCNHSSWYINRRDLELLVSTLINLSSSGITSIQELIFQCVQILVFWSSDKDDQEIPELRLSDPSHQGWWILDGIHDTS